MARCPASATGSGKFRNNPASLRNATALLISIMVVVVLIGAAIMRISNRDEYPTFAKALWFTLQTITTVGYRDVTPTETIGRVIASVVMLTGIALVTVATAAFVEAARARTRLTEHGAEEATLARLEASLGDIASRLERLESTLGTDLGHAGTTTRENPDG